MVKIGIGLARDSSPWMHNVTGSCYIRLGDEKEEVQDVGDVVR